MLHVIFIVVVSLLVYDMTKFLLLLVIKSAKKFSGYKIKVERRNN